MSGAFPGLGFDPAPGEPDEVRRCAREHARAAAELDGLAAVVSSAGAVSASWRGAAATAFADSLAPLSRHLRVAADAFGDIAARLTAWASELDHMQAQARMLEREAEQAFDRLHAAHARAAVSHVTASALVVSGTHVLDTDGAKEDLRRVTARAEDLHATWRAAGRRLASAVESAAAAAPPLPRTVGEFVWDHRVAIARTANTASFLSLPALAIPLVGPLVSGTLSAAALTGYSALAVHADGSGTDVALGAAGIGLGGGASVVRAAAGPAAGAASGVVQRGLAYGDVGTWTVSTGRGLLGSPVPPPTPPRPSSVPTLRRLLVAPVTAPLTGPPPSRKHR